MHCCCRCCCPAAPGPDRRRLLPCRLWATALWTSQCLPPAVWDLWCPHRWRCMFAPKAPTGCFCCPAASRRRRTKIRRGRRRGRVRTRSRIISQVAGICKSLPAQCPVKGFPLYGFFSVLLEYFVRRHQIRQPVARATSAVPQLSPPFATFVACCCSLCSLNTSSTGVPTQGDLHAASDPYRDTRAIMKYFSLLHFVSFRFGLDLGFIPVSCHTPRSGPLAKS